MLFRSAAFGVIRSLIFWWIFAENTKKRIIAGKVALYIFLAISLVVGIMAINTAMKTDVVAGYIQLFSMVCAVLFVIGQYLPGNHFVRIFQVLYSIAMFLIATPLNILEGDFRWNIMGMVIESFKIISIIFFYCMLYQRKWVSNKLIGIKENISNTLLTLKTNSCLTEEEKKTNEKQLETLSIRLLKYELYAIDKNAITNIVLAQNCVDKLIVDTKVIAQAKDILPEPQVKEVRK